MEKTRMTDQTDTSLVPAAKPDSPAAISTLRPCIACGSELPSTASVCSRCRQYQKAWKNRLQYWAGVSTLIVMAASALLWSATNMRRLLWPREELRLISANSMRSAVFFNQGDKEVFVSH